MGGVVRCGDTMTNRETQRFASCPTAEQIAAFLDGAVAAGERRRILVHLASCESCYEVLAGSAHVLSWLAGAMPGAAAGQLIPLSDPHTVRRSSTWRRAAGLTAAAAALAMGIGVPIHRSLSIPPPMVVTELVATLAPALCLEHLLHERGATRGDRGAGAVVPEDPSFLVGALEVDLRLSVAAGDVGRSSRLLADLGEWLRDVDLMERQGDAYRAEALRLTSADALRRLAAETPAQEAALESKGSSLLPEWVAFGKWTEAGRLAAASQTPAFFATSRNRRFLGFLRRGRLLPLDPGVEAALGRIETLWDHGSLTPADFAGLEAELARITAHESLLLDGSGRSID
jgi:hypothetical protein